VKLKAFGIYEEFRPGKKKIKLYLLQGSKVINFLEILVIFGNIREKLWTNAYGIWYGDKP
jgi:hypothetical protein